MRAVLKATNENWGLTRAGDWKRTEYVLDQNGSLHIKVYYLHPIVDISVKVSDEDMLLIRDNIEGIITNPPGFIPEACDGEAWSFKAYDDTGKQIFKWKLSHIYGLDPLENIGKILDSYIPEYEEPEYTEEEIEDYIIQYTKEYSEMSEDD